MYSPVIEKGQADIIVSFEQLEAARWLSSLKKGGTVITNSQKISPMPVITGAAQYPADIDKKLSDKVDATLVDALSLAKQAGTSKAVNVVLIGVMAKSTDIPYEKWVETIKTTVPEKFLEVNLKAFELGRGE